MAEHPTEESINITRKFMGQQAGAPGQTPSTGASLPSQAAPGVKKRSLGQQGAPQDSLGSQFLDLPGPVGFASTPQGKAMLQRILGQFGRRR